MAVSLLTPRSLTEMISTIVPVKPFILTLIFKTKKQHFTEVVDIPVKKSKRRLARFSRRTSPANVADKVDYDIKTIRIPHIREKAVSSAATALTQANNGGIYADKSQIEAHKMNVADDLAQLKERALTRMEWMACQALKGTITVTSDDVAFTFDFGFDSSHKPVKTGTAVWDGVDKNIVADLTAWKRKILTDFGVAPDVCIMGTNAADAFLADADVRKILDNNNLAAGRLTLENGDYAGNYLGRFMGMDIYEYAQSYIDDNDAAQDMFNPDALAMYSSKAPFIQHFAPVVDLKAGLMPVEFFSKSWDEEDPSQSWLLTETNPLPVIENPNCIVYAVVL